MLTMSTMSTSTKCCQCRQCSSILVKHRRHLDVDIILLYIIYYYQYNINIIRHSVLNRLITCNTLLKLERGNYVNDNCNKLLKIYIIFNFLDSLFDMPIDKSLMLSLSYYIVVVVVKYVSCVTSSK